MIIKTAEFVCSSPDYRDCPESMLKEFAFIGRSNVGKSSLINMLVNNRKLAKTSSSPGKTQLINHFLINNSWYIVDLPGFGYARVSKTTRYKWGKMLSIYLTKRETLACIFVLIDSRHKPQRIDLEFMSWLAEKNVPFCMVFTKTDKLSKAELIKKPPCLKHGTNCPLLLPVRLFLVPDEMIFCLLLMELTKSKFSY